MRISAVREIFPDNSNFFVFLLLAGIVQKSDYGFATRLPVLLFAVAVALGLKAMNQWFLKVTALEKYMRKVTGVIFGLGGDILFMDVLCRIRKLG